LFRTVDEIEWGGATPAFDEQAAAIGDARLLPRARKALAGLKS
jgi:hypothetical protein